MHQIFPQANLKMDCDVKALISLACEMIPDKSLGVIRIFNVLIESFESSD